MSWSKFRYALKINRTDGITLRLYLPNVVQSDVYEIQKIKCGKKGNNVYPLSEAFLKIMTGCEVSRKRTPLGIAIHFLQPWSMCEFKYWEVADCPKRPYWGGNRI